jgi:hypothetical protein
MTDLIPGVECSSEIEAEINQKLNHIDVIIKELAIKEYSMI